MTRRRAGSTNPYDFSYRGVTRRGAAATIAENCRTAEDLRGTFPSPSCRPSNFRNVKRGTRDDQKHQCAARRSEGEISRTKRGKCMVFVQYDAKRKGTKKERKRLPSTKRTLDKIRTAVDPDAAVTCARHIERRRGYIYMDAVGRVVRAVRGER
ncbi:hypothetical protein ALC53_07630 [Atta colombica]|uniref:Uncharacterized protein n=1 Tax=Atta colombica TaxID=520822 RepID=A0A195BBC9_9HYME|nr:hypothetical protein ALC53_07630 [Atta colombica]